MKVITLREGRERSLQRRHPWVFEGSIARGRADPGETVKVVSCGGEFLAWAAFSPSSSIRVRAWSFDEAERIDASFFERRLMAALAWRGRLPVASDGIRLVHGEADGLPGLVVDRYGDVLSVQFLSAGAQRWQAVIADALLSLTGCTRLYERSDSSVRALEGLPIVKGWLRGSGPTELTLREHSWHLSVDVDQGHKTGFYLDQRDNRWRVGQAVRQYGLKRVLNTYGYTGGFSVAALQAGAERVVTVDSSGPSLARAMANVALNGLEAGRHEVREADVNLMLRQCLAGGESYDAIILDPPKFAPTAAHAERAARAYKDINRLAFKLLPPGGLLFTFSCSGGVGPELFQKIVAGAAIDALTDACVIERLAATPDHPHTMAFPEGEYLKGLVLMKR